MDAIGEGLRRLPPVDPAPDTWSDILASVSERSRSKARWGWPVAVTAMAASLILVLTMGVRLADSERSDGNLVFAPSADLQELQRRSYQLEALTQPRLGIDPAEAALLYRIADVDSQLVGYDPDPRLPSEEKLWEQRVVTLQSLAEIQRVRTTTQPALY